MKIAVAGTGYVGLSIATLPAQRNEEVAVDVIPEMKDGKPRPLHIDKALAVADLSGSQNPRLKRCRNRSGCCFVSLGKARCAKATSSCASRKDRRSLSPPPPQI